MITKSQKLFGDFAQEFSQNILPIYKKHEETFDSAGIHGRLHICRCLVYGEIMARIYEHFSLTIDYLAMRMAIAFHDSGRQGNGQDIWEEDSGDNLQRYLIDRGETRGYAEHTWGFVVKLAGHKGPYCSENEIARAADCLDIMRPVCAMTSGIEGFRQNLFPFMDGTIGPLPHMLQQRERQSLRDKLIGDSWTFIKATETIKWMFNSTENKDYLEKILLLLCTKKSLWPFFFEYLGDL